MADAFPGGVLVFDAANRTAVKMIAKTWLRTAKIKDVGAYFAVSDAPKEIGEWDSRLRVSSRGYMMGYNDLKDPSVSGFFRFLAKVGDKAMTIPTVMLVIGGRRCRFWYRVQAFRGAIWAAISCAAERMSLCLRGETGLRRSSRMACGSRTNFRSAPRSAAFRW